VVSLAGPFSALFLLGLPAWWLESSSLVTSPDVQHVLSQVVWVNVGFSLLNLLPILPLDGGAVMLAVLDAITGGKGRRSAEVVSVIFSVVLVAAAVYSGFFFLGVLAAMFAGMNLTALSSASGAARARCAHRSFHHRRGPRREAVRSDAAVGRRARGVVTVVGCRRPRGR
jgi:Zn-dependent protease